MLVFFHDMKRVALNGAEQVERVSSKLSVAVNVQWRLQFVSKYRLQLLKPKVKFQHGVYKLLKL